MKPVVMSEMTDHPRPPMGTEKTVEEETLPWLDDDEEEEEIDPDDFETLRRRNAEMVQAHLR